MNLYMLCMGGGGGGCYWVGFLSSFSPSFYMLSASVLHTCIFMLPGFSHVMDNLGYNYISFALAIKYMCE